jgi:hypothetical protein
MTVRAILALSEIRTRHLRNTSPKHLRFEPTCFVTMLHNTPYLVSFSYLSYFFIYLSIHSLITSFSKVLCTSSVMCWARLQCDGTCAKDNCYVCVKQMSPYSLTADMSGKRVQFAADSWNTSWRGLPPPLSCFPFISSISRKFVPSHSNRAKTFRILIAF